MTAVSIGATSAGESGIVIVGLPATPSPLVTVTLLAVPVMVRAAAVPAPVRATRPRGGQSGNGGKVRVDGLRTDRSRRERV